MQNNNATQKIAACSFDVSFKNSEPKNFRRLTKTRAYIFADQPKDLLSMFSDRFNSPTRSTTNAVKRAIASQINTEQSLSISESDISLKWDQYAGCSCPCSPGYIVTFHNQSVPFNYQYSNQINLRTK